jgi:hypothetical protein
VSEDVGERLLRHAKEAETDIGHQPIDVGLAEYHLDLMICFDIGAMTP